MNISCGACVGPSSSSIIIPLPAANSRDVVGSQLPNAAAAYQDHRFDATWVWLLLPGSLARDSRVFLDARIGGVVQTKMPWEAGPHVRWPTVGGRPLAKAT